MKRCAFVLCLFVLFTTTGCVKALLKDKDEDVKPSDKYAGTWNLTAGAVDLNGNGQLDANERKPISLASQLTLNKDLTFTYFLSGANPPNMEGKWVLSTDGKSISISDRTGAIRFDILSDNELRTEPIPDAGNTYWLFYTR